MPRMTLAWSKNIETPSAVDVPDLDLDCIQAASSVARLSCGEISCGCNDTLCAEKEYHNPCRKHQGLDTTGRTQIPRNREWSQPRPDFERRSPLARQLRPRKPLCQVVQNIARLAVLLHKPNKPAEFGLPRCIGYIDDSEKLCFGLILESFSARSRSLLSWFNDHHVGISRRVEIARKIAESLLYLHAVNWLHKGLRSAGIVFGKGPSGSDDGLENLCLSGFGFSRPSSDSFTTTGSPRDSNWSRCCHPEYLDPDRKTRYRKTYDIHSLGIILVEIAHWSPINQILQTSNSGRDFKMADHGQDFRSQILESDSTLTLVRQNMGERYFVATKACLEGPMAFGLLPHADQSNPYVATLLQQSFIETVVNPLKEIVV